MRIRLQICKPVGNLRIFIHSNVFELLNPGIFRIDDGVDDILSRILMIDAVRYQPPLLVTLPI